MKKLLESTAVEETKSSPSTPKGVKTQSMVKPSPKPNVTKVQSPEQADSTVKRGRGRPRKQVEMNNHYCTKTRM